jgi:hypothetical protein
MSIVIVSEPLAPSSNRVSGPSLRPAGRPPRPASGGVTASASSARDGVAAARFSLGRCSSGVDAGWGAIARAIGAPGDQFPGSAGLFAPVACPTCASCGDAWGAAGRSSPRRSPGEAVSSASATAPASSEAPASSQARQSSDTRRFLRRSPRRNGSCVGLWPSSSTTSLWRTYPGGVKGGAVARARRGRADRRLFEASARAAVSPNMAVSV